MSRLTPAEQLTTTLTTVSSFQEAIRLADTKATMFVTLQGMLLALIGTGWTPESGLWATVTATVSVCCAMVACVRFAVALLPRTAGLPRSNRFGFVSVAANPAPNGDRDVDRLQSDAWQLAVLLAEIATVKHRHVRAGMPWLGASAVAALAVASQWPGLLR